MSFFPNSPPRELRPAKTQKKTEEPKTGVPALIRGIKDLEKERDTYKAELGVRSQQLSNLCTMCMTLRMVLTRLEKGSFSENDHQAITPPPVKKYLSNGTVDGYEYIRASLSMMRPSIVGIHNDRLGLRRDLSSMERAITAISVADEDEEQEGIQGGVEYARAPQLLEEIDDDE